MAIANKSRNMQVMLRIRPSTLIETERNQREIIVRVIDPNTIIFDPEEEDDDDFFFHGRKQPYRAKRINKNLTFRFDRVFDSDANNHEIFEFAIRPLIASLMDGYNCSVFVYGATGAGKTFTMLGNDLVPGITFLATRELFEQIERNSNKLKIDIGVAYLEVYNEQVKNLLTKKGSLRLQEDRNGVVVGGLVLQPIFNADELLSLLAMGNRNRTQHPTDSNAESSRSHAIFQVHIRMTNKSDQRKRLVKLSMIDLAGSERACSSKCVGERFKEGANINRSLLALGNCINKLADNSVHIPYRDSNLTRILKDSLGGNCRTVMIANISPARMKYEDTYNTLKYATRALQIRTKDIRKSQFQSNLPTDYYVSRLDEQAQMIKELKKHVQDLEVQLTVAKTATSRDGINQPTVNSNINSHIDHWIYKIDKIYDDTQNVLEKYYAKSSRLMLFTLRTKYEQYYDQNSKMLNIDREVMKRDSNTKDEASKDKCNRRIEGFQNDKDLWMCRLTASRIQLTELRSEIGNLNNPIIDSYMCQKDFEMKAIEMKMKLEHAKKVLHFYDQTSDKARKMLELSDEITDELYSVLGDNQLITDEMREKIAQLYKLHDQQSFDQTELDDVLGTHIQYLFDDNFLLADIIVAANSNNGQQEISDETVVISTKDRAIQSTHSNEDNINSTVPNKPTVRKLEPNVFSPRSERKHLPKSISKRRDNKHSRTSVNEINRDWIKRRKDDISHLYASNLKK